MTHYKFQLEWKISTVTFDSSSSPGASFCCWKWHSRQRFKWSCVCSFNWGFTEISNQQPNVSILFVRRESVGLESTRKLSSGQFSSPRSVYFHFGLFHVYKHLQFVLFTLSSHHSFRCSPTKLMLFLRQRKLPTFNSTTTTDVPQQTISKYSFRIQ